MKIASAFFAVVLIWSSTPLAIKWSGQEVGPFFGILTRMLIALVICVCILLLSRQKFPVSRLAWRNYVAAGFGLYMITFVYWGAQHINSGVISVIFGLTPVVTALMARVWLAERISVQGYTGLLLGFLGLIVLFEEQLYNQISVSLGMLAIIMAVFSHSFSSVWVKRLSVNISPLASTTGGLLVSMPFYFITWYFSTEKWPHELQTYTVLSIVYLALMGSVVGFSIYFYLLKRISASRAALITFLTPILSLTIGVYFNEEKVSFSVVMGTGLILLSMLIFHFRGVHEEVTPNENRTN